MQLPPRTPQWMPLDYSVWHQVETKVLSTCTGSMSKKEYIKKLRRAAMSLKKPFLQKVVGDLPRRINHVVQAKGSFTGKD